MSNMPTIPKLVGLVAVFATADQVTAAGYTFDATSGQPGATAVICHHGRWYRGVLAEVHANQAAVTFVTPTAVRRSETNGEPIRSTTTRAPLALVAIESTDQADVPAVAARPAGTSTDQAFARLRAASLNSVARPDPHEQPALWARVRLADLALVVDGWETILAENPDVSTWARYAVEQQIEAARRERAFLGSLIG